MVNNLRDAVYTALFNVLVCKDSDAVVEGFDANTYFKPIDHNEFGDVDFFKKGIRVGRIDDYDDSIYSKDYEFGQYIRVGEEQLLFFGGKEFVDDMIDDILHDFYGVEKPSLEEMIANLPF